MLAVSDEIRLLEQVRSALADLGAAGTAPEPRGAQVAAH